MTLQYYSGNRISGLSTDTKPTTAQDKAVFYQTDDGKTFDFTLSSTTWTERSSALTALSNLTLESKTQTLSDWLIMQKTTPSVATNLVATADGVSTITDTYDLLDTDKITAVKVEYSLDNSSWTTASTTANATSYQITGLSEYTDYYFRVYATNVMGMNTTPTTTGSITKTWGIPTQVSGLSATHDSTNITLNWSAVTNDNPTATYTIEHSLSSSFASGVTVLATTGNLTYADEATKDVRHYYRIRATNTAGNGSYSAIVNDLIIDGTITVTGSPTLSTAGGYNYYEWSQNGTVTVEGYQVEVLVVGGGGSGGSWNGGGGAGGGVVYTGLITAPTGSQNVVIGAGGNSVTNNSGNSGSSSSLFGITSGGGGYGGGSSPYGAQAGGAGGNSGGAGGTAGGGGSGGGGSGGTSGSITGTYSADYVGGTYYGGGAGSGGVGIDGGYQAGNSAGGAGTNVSSFSGFGDSGIFGNGHRGNYSETNASHGADGTGDGGNGTKNNYASGHGGKGTVIIRWQS